MAINIQAHLVHWKVPVKLARSDFSQWILSTFACWKHKRLFAILPGKALLIRVSRETLCCVWLINDPFGSKALWTDYTGQWRPFKSELYFKSAAADKHLNQAKS